MDFSRFDSLESKAATIAMAKVEKAIAEDMKAQKRKFVKTEFSRFVDAAYGLSNKSSLRYGAAIGRKIIKGTPLKKTDAFVRGSDLAKVVYYALDMEGHLPWVNLRQTLKDLGLNELSSVTTSQPLEAPAQVVRDGIMAMDYTTASLAAQLIELSRKVAPIEAQRDALLKKLNTQNLTILNQVNQLTERNELILELNNSILRLKAGIEAQKDEKLKAQMLKMLDSMLKKFDDLSL